MERNSKKWKLKGKVTALVCLDIFNFMHHKEISKIYGQLSGSNPPHSNGGEKGKVYIMNLLLYLCDLTLSNIREECKPGLELRCILLAFLL